MIRKLFSLAVLVCLIGGTLVHGQVVINEVSASNLTSLADNFGDFEDWIELYNGGATAFDISGYYLSDSQNNNTKYQFAPGTSVPAGGYLLIYASGRGLTTPPLHASFKLNQTRNEWVVLSDPTGAVVDDYQLLDPTKFEGSRGRTTDGAPTWSLFETATPNAANVGASPEYTDKPILSPGAGFYGGAQSVTMSSPVAGAQIYYTLDGSTPTAASTLYTGPINIANTTVVRAVAIDPTPGVPASFIETNTYFINVTHTVPVISGSADQLLDLLNGDGSLQPFGMLEYFGADGLLKDEAYGEYNEHGQDSWAYDQRGVDYVARDQSGYNNGINHEIFRTKTRDRYQRLIIKAAAGDNYEFGPGQPAHIRDAYVQALSQVGKLHLDERSYEPCVFYINGQYWGVYDVREKVDDADFTSYYYDQTEWTTQFLKTWGGTWSEYGGPQSQTDWDALVNFIMTNNMGDPTAFAYVDSLLSWKSLIDYFCINSYTVCSDWLNWNTGWWRGLNPNGKKKKWRYILWDMDATFDHYANFTGIPNQGVDADPCQAENLGDPGGQGHTEILTKLMDENDMIRDYYVNRYIDLGNTVFSCDFMLPFLDSLIANITPEMPGQIARWGGSVADWQANVQVMRTFIEDRCVTIQTGLVDCYDVTGPYDVVFDVYPPLAGEIKVNSTVLPNYPFDGIYYGGITTNIEAISGIGWAFGYWTIQNDTIYPSLNDSIAWLTIDVADTIVAHFVPPTRYDVVLMTDPPGKADIEFDNTLYTSFPTFTTAPEGVPVPMEVFPEEYWDFQYWELKNHSVSPADTTDMSVEVSFWQTDTIIAHLKPQEYHYYVPNSFTPNGDGNNDFWQPLGSAVVPEEFDMKIFNRWGELIYESQDWLAGWDGTSNGSPVPDGVYVYRIVVRDGISKDKHELFGHVTTFR